MIDFIKAITPLGIAAAVLIVAVLFRAEIRKLVSWLVGFRRIRKTNDGYEFSPAVDNAGDTPSLRESEKEALVTIARQSEESDDGSPTVTTRKTWGALFAERRWDEAAEVLTEEAQREPDRDKRIQALSFVGHILFEKDAKEGIAYFEQLFKEYPTSFHPYLWCALSFLWKELLEKSLQVIARGIDNASEKGPLFETRADVYMRAGNLDEAFTAARDGTEVSPTYVENYITIANIEVRREHLDLARQWFWRAVEVSNASESVMSRYAAFLRENKFDDEALLRYRQLALAYPKNSEYHGYLGNAYLAAGFIDAALEAYITADKLAENKEAWIVGNIANVYNRQKLFSRGEAFARRAIELDATSQYAIDRLAASVNAQEEERAAVRKLLEKTEAVAPTGLLASPKQTSASAVENEPG